MKGTLYKNERTGRPVEGKFFQVDPKTIKRELFNYPREDEKQEWVRQRIIMVLNDSQCDEKPFKTFYPEKTWEDAKTVEEIKQIAKEAGGQIAFLWQQILEWAQRISNGETWEEVCNKKDNSMWYRLVVTERNVAYLVGACYLFGINVSATDIIQVMKIPGNRLNYAVPLIVYYN